MADGSGSAPNPGIAAMKAAGAKKRNAASNVASQIGGKTPGSGNNNPARSAAIARRLNKGSSKSKSPTPSKGPTPGPNDNDGDEQESGY